jgi:hypothetical protein
VLSTALGSRLREVSGARRFDDQLDDDFLDRQALADARSSFCLPRRSSWHGRELLGRHRLPALILLGGVFGGIAGGSFLVAVIGDRTSAAGIVVGSISLAVLGGWFMFLTSSFYLIFRHGLREAIAEQEKDESLPRSW